MCHHKYTWNHKSEQEEKQENESLALFENGAL